MCAEQTSEQSQGSILVVEDDNASLKMLVGVLTDAGYRARPAFDGELGLRSVQAQKPDLILMDFKLPGMNGVEVCRQLKDSPETREIPVIFISALRATELKVKALSAGAVDFVTKPIEPAEVLARISTHLEKYRLQKKLETRAAELLRHRESLEELVNERTAELHSSEAKFRNLFQTIADSIMVIDPENALISDVNSACESLYGYSKEELLKMTLQDVSHEPQKSVAALEPTVKGRLTHVPERFHKKKDGTVFPVDITVGRLRANGKDFVYELIRDITERKAAEAKIKASLKEKDVLLREIHHRVKNNMQVIVSLLRLQARRTNDEHVRLVFNECRDRINAMALIHEALYESRDVGQVDFDAYLSRLCRHLSLAYCPSGQKIDISIAPSRVWLGLDQSVAVGMVICELVSNAFKHAFTPDRKGSVSITLTRLVAGEIQLTVQDDGVGLPEEVDLNKPQSLGLDLAVSAVTDELGGTIEVFRDGGTKFVLRFESRERNGKDSA